jgi:hypothetical protein
VANSNKGLRVKIKLIKMVAAFFLIGSVAAANAGVCAIVPGSLTCGSGTVASLTGNGVITVNGTTVTGATQINGLLSAEDASFVSLDVNGGAKLVQCTITDAATIKGSLTASSTKFESTLEVYSSETRLINSTVRNNLHVGNTDSKKQVVYLDDYSEISGDIIFDDGNGEVILRGRSKIVGKVIGGNTVSK